MKSNISLKRIGLLIKRHFVEIKNFKVVLLIFCIAASCFGFYELLPGFNFITPLLLGSFILSSRSDSTYKTESTWFGNSVQMDHYILIPASILEKTITQFLINTVFMFIIITLAYFVGSILHSGITSFLSDAYHPLNWDFLSSKGLVITKWRNGEISSDITLNIWALFGNIAFVQALTISINANRGSIIVLAMAFLLLAYIFLFTLDTFDYGFTNYLFERNGLFSYTLAAFIWLINYHLLNRKQLQ